MPHTFKRILTLSGSNLDGGAPACPISGSLYVADVGYEIRVRRYTTLAEGFHARTWTRDVLVARDYYCLPLRKDDEAGSFGRNAYLCLKRGNECGGDDFAREVAHMRDTDGAAPGKKAIYRHRPYGKGCPRHCFFCRR